jgi:hypothetical protein
MTAQEHLKPKSKKLPPLYHQMKIPSKDQFPWNLPKLTNVPKTNRLAPIKNAPRINNFSMGMEFKTKSLQSKRELLARAAETRFELAKTKSNE